MLTVTLVATFAVTALWQQWRATEIETAERARVQAAWILTGALDWARLILREDARAGGPDHFGEPWAIALQEARLSTFLAVDRQATETERDAFLSGAISDLQARFNLSNLLQGEDVDENAVEAFERLLERLDLPPALAGATAAALKRARQGTGDPQAPLRPERVGQLGMLGLPPAAVEALRREATLLPERTPVNLNTASLNVLVASIEGLDVGGAQRLIAAREREPLRSLADAVRLLPALEGQIKDGLHGVASSHFEVRGRLRLDDLAVEELSVVKRSGLSVSTLWRERVSSRGAAAGSPPLQ
jgi:general secretion pathway protein K